MSTDTFEPTHNVYGQPLVPRTQWINWGVFLLFALGLIVVINFGFTYLPPSSTVVPYVGAITGFFVGASTHTFFPLTALTVSAFAARRKIPKKERPPVFSYIGSFLLLWLIHIPHVICSAFFSAYHTLYFLIEFIILWFWKKLSIPSFNRLRFPRIYACVNHSDLLNAKTYVHNAYWIFTVKFLRRFCPSFYQSFMYWHWMATLESEPFAKSKTTVGTKPSFTHLYHLTLWDPNLGPVVSPDSPNPMRIFDIMIKSVPANYLLLAFHNWGLSRPPPEFPITSSFDEIVMLRPDDFAPPIERWFSQSENHIIENILTPEPATTSPSKTVRL